MAEFRQKDSSLWISKRRETAYNTPYTTGADFIRATSTNPVVLLPEMEKTDDAGRTGNDSEFPTTQFNQHWLPIPASLTDRANFDLAGRLSLRGVGGAVNSTVVVASVAFKHVGNMLPKTNLFQPSSSLISELGGASFLVPGAVVDRMRMSQDGANPVQVQFDLISSGKHRQPHGVTTLPAPPIFNFLNLKPFLQYNDGTLRDLAASCRFRSWFIEINYGHSPQEERCAGDPQQIAGDYTVAAGPSAASYITKITRGDRSISAEIVILLDSTTPEWVQMAANTPLTNLVFGARGKQLDAAGPTDESLKWIVPRATFSAVKNVDSNGKAALTLSFKTIHDTVAQGVQVEVVNDVAVGLYD